MSPVFLILFAAALAVTVFVAMVLPKKRTSRATYETRHSTLVHNVSVDRHNAFIDRINKISNTFNDKLYDLQRQIILNQDAEAFYQAECIVKEFSYQIDQTKKKLSESAEAIKREDFRTSEAILDDIEKDIDKHSALCKALSRITINRIHIKQKTTPSPPNLTSTSYFEGCNDKEEINARYKALAKAFHPDNKGGDPGMFRKLTEEYTLLTKE